MEEINGGGGKLRRFAQISDVHVFDDEQVWNENVGSFVGQRFLGLMNILFLRGPDRYSKSVLEKAVDDMKEIGVEHLICAGDVTNLAIESEFKKAREIFCGFGGGSRNMMFVPGNHDTYSRSQRKCGYFNKYFGEFAVSDVKVRSPRGDGFPIVQERGGVMFVGLNSGRPNTARGMVGRAQWEAARDMLDSRDGRDLMENAGLKVLVVHHPTQDPKIRALPWIRDLGHDLKDWQEVGKFCEEYGFDLSIHGHNHVPYQGRMRGCENTLVYEAGSGTMLVEDLERIARYNVFELGDNGNLERSFARVWNVEKEGFDTKELPIPAPGPPEPVEQPAFVRDVIE